MATPSNIKNITELRESLTENYHLLKSKKMPLSTGKELANTAGKILTACKVELEYNAVMGIKRTIKFLEQVQ